MNSPIPSLRHLPAPLLLAAALTCVQGARAELLPPQETPVAPETAVAQENPPQQESEAREPAAKLIASVGYEYLKDASTPGQETTQTTIPFALARATDDYVFEVHIPYIQRTAPSGMVSSHHHESEHGTTTAPLISNAGLGDITASLVMPLTDEKHSSTSLYAKGEFKFATASLAKGLGTGANDYSLEFIARHAAASYHGEISVGYANLGSPGTVDVNEVKKTFYYRNIYFGSLSGNYHLTERFEAGLKLDLAQAADANGSQQRDLSAVAEYKFAGGNSMRMELLKSLAAGVNIRGFSATFFAPF